MGRKRVVVAVLLEHSVKVPTSRHSSREMANGGICCSGARLSPSHLDSPEAWSEIEVDRQTDRQLLRYITWKNRYET